MFQKSAIRLRRDGSKIKVKTITIYTENYPEVSNVNIHVDYNHHSEKGNSFAIFQKHDIIQFSDRLIIVITRSGTIQYVTVLYLL